MYIYIEDTEKDCYWELNVTHLLMVFLGGGLGSVLRYLIKIFCDKTIGLAFPWGTFSVNIIGSLFLGFLFALLLNKTDLLDTNSKLFLTVGFAGGFTTFSTFSLESVNLIKEGCYTTSFVYVLSSVILGICAVYLGTYLAKYV